MIHVVSDALKVVNELNGDEDWCIGNFVKDILEMPKLFVALSSALCLERPIGLLTILPNLVLFTRRVLSGVGSFPIRTACCSCFFLCLV